MSLIFFLPVGNDKEVVPWFALFDDDLAVLKADSFQRVCHSQPLPLVQVFYKQQLK